MSTRPEDPPALLFPYTTLFRSVAVGEETSTRVVEPHALERELPWWYVHSWDRTKDGQRSFRLDRMRGADRKSTRLNSSHLVISYAVFCLKKKNVALKHNSNIYI